MTDAERAVPSSFQTAYHEAGHAVAAHVLGLGFDSVSVRGGDDFFGDVLFPGVGERVEEGYFNDADPSNRKWLWNHLVVSFAGWWGEYLGTGVENDEGAECDFRNARDFVVWLARDDQELQTLGPQAESEAETLVREHFAAVGRVAEALVERAELSSSEVAALVQEDST